MQRLHFIGLAMLVFMALFALACGGGGGSTASTTATTTSTYKVEGTVDNSVLTKADLSSGYEIWATQGSNSTKGAFVTSGNSSEDATYSVNMLKSAGEYTVKIVRVGTSSNVETMSSTATAVFASNVLSKSAAKGQINMFTTAAVKILAENPTFTVAKTLELMFGKDSGVTSLDSLYSDAGVVKTSGNVALPIVNNTVKLALTHLTTSVMAINLMPKDLLSTNKLAHEGFSANVIKGASSGNIDTVMRNTESLSALTGKVSASANLYNRMLSADPIGTKALVASAGNSTFEASLLTIGAQANSSNVTNLARIRQGILIQTAAATKLAALAAGANITKFDEKYNLVINSDNVIKSFITLATLNSRSSDNLIALAKDPTIAGRTGANTTLLVSSANTSKNAATAKPSGATNGNKSLSVAGMKANDPLSKQRTQVVPGSKNVKKSKGRMAGKESSVSHASKTPYARSQGSTGSCSSWAVAYYKSWQENMEEGWATSSDNVPFFSPMFLFSMQCQDKAKFNSKFPYSTELSAEILKAYGCPLDKTLPYHDFKHGENTGDIQDALENAAYAGAINTENASYKTLPEARTAVTNASDADTYGVMSAGVELSNPAAVYRASKVNGGNTIDAAYIAAARKEAARYKAGDKNTDFNYYDETSKKWLMKFDQLKEAVRAQPVVLGIEKFGGPDGTSPEQNFFYKKVDANGHGAGHAIVCIGFNDDKACPDGTKGAWLLRNSWGKDSGENGDTWLPYSAQADLITSAMTIKDMPNVRDVAVATPPKAPESVSATTDKEPITVTWNKVSGASSYKIYRKVAKGKFALAGKSDINNFTDYPRGGDYWYFVTAVNEKGESKMLPTEDGVKGTSVVAGKVATTSAVANTTVAGNATVISKDPNLTSSSSSNTTREIVMTPYLDVVAASGRSANIMVSANISIIGTSATNVLVNELTVDANTTVLHFLVSDSLQGPWTSMGYTTPAKNVVLIWEAKSEFVGDAPLLKAQFMDEAGNSSGFSNIIKLKKVEAKISDPLIKPLTMSSVTATVSSSEVGLTWTTVTGSGNADTEFVISMKDKDDAKAEWVVRGSETGSTWSDNVAPQGVNLIYAVTPVYAGIEGNVMESNAVKVAISSGNPVSIDNAAESPVTYVYDEAAKTLSFSNLVLGNYGSTSLGNTQVLVTIKAYKSTLTVNAEGELVDSAPEMLAIGTTHPNVGLSTQAASTCDNLLVTVPSEIFTTTANTLYMFSVSANTSGTEAAQEVIIDAPWTLDSALASVISEQFGVSESLTSEDGEVIDESDISDESMIEVSEELVAEIFEEVPEFAPEEVEQLVAEIAVADPTEEVAGEITESGDNTSGGNTSIGDLISGGNTSVGDLTSGGNISTGETTSSANTSAVEVSGDNLITK